MTNRNHRGSPFLYWRVPHLIRLMLTPVLLPRLMLGAAFLYTPVSQPFQRSRRPA
jgi:hypothetical protein